MKSARGSSSSFQGNSVNGVDLILTGLPMQVLQRPSSASPGKHIARSISVITENKPKRNILEDAGLATSRAMNNLRRSNSTTQVNQQMNDAIIADHHDDFLTLFNSSSTGRKKLASLSKDSPEKKTTWNILDEQPRIFPASSSTPGSMRKKEICVPLAANFTANNRSNKGAMGNCVTTMVHNNYSTTDKVSVPKSSNQATTSLNNIIKATSNEDTDSSSYMKSQKNFSSSNILAWNNNTSSSSPPARIQEVSEEEAERFVNQVNSAAVTIQRWYRWHSQRHKEGVAQLERLLASKREEKQQQQQQTDEGNILDLQQRRDEERKKIREEKARLARRAAIQELQQKRTQKALETQRLVEEELAVIKEGKKARRRKSEKASSLKNSSPANSIIKANNAGANFHFAGIDLEEASAMPSLCRSAQNKGLEEQPQDGSSGKMPSEDLDGMMSTASRMHSKITFHDLLDTLKLLEADPEFLPLLPYQTKVFKDYKYAWIDGDLDSISLTTDNVEKFGKLNCSLGAPEEGTLLSETKLQNIMSFLDEMEKSEQERPRSVASASQQEGLLPEEELAHLDQVSAVATEVTSSIQKLKLEVEEKKRAVAFLQRALAQQQELTGQHVKDVQKELTHQLTMQREQYEAAIQRHLAFIDQLIDDKRALNQKCEAVVSELKLVDQKYTKKIAQMQEQHELVWRTLGPLCEEIKKLKQLMTATEKIRREKWIDEKTKKIKEITVKGLEPEIQKLIAKHKLEIKKLKSLHEVELLQSDERAAQRYIRQTEELKEMLEHEKEEQGQRERELARQRYEKQLEQEEQSLQQQRRRLYNEVAEEKERLNQQAARQRAQLEDLRKQLEENNSIVTKALKEEYEKGKEEQERRHQVEIQTLKMQLDMEKQAWEASYLKKEEAWLLTRERELREEVRKERDKEIELVIQKLEADMSSAKDECERIAENRIKRMRDKYELELRELELSERKFQERCNELKGRLLEAESETVRLQGLLRQKEQEVEDIRKVKDQLAQERSSLSEVIRQEFADRLVTTEEDNKHLKIEMAELRARQRLELDRVMRDKEEELEEVHKRVKTAIVKKEEAVNSFRKQYEAAMKRAEHLESLLEQQRKQLLATK
ncbi:centrosomal protein of 131 kDa isoform X2 [Ahaetulla prasina]|uniref:centrosomal protein of 131 kDa isoform X2 n=1 Tax=Ahaetulla prasina TaxID=499056 RepID=UPI0026489117|nr:centrosomal protein of 131 kDa isoform X2 [Ahaetulla prasina]